MPHILPAMITEAAELNILLLPRMLSEEAVPGLSVHPETAAGDHTPKRRQEQQDPTAPHVQLSCSHSSEMLLASCRVIGHERSGGSTGNGFSVTGTGSGGCRIPGKT